MLSCPDFVAVRDVVAPAHVAFASVHSLRDAVETLAGLDGVGHCPALALLLRAGGFGTSQKEDEGLLGGW